MQYTQDELNKILADHKLWFNSNGKEGKRANLIEANLIGANLSGAYLKDANLSGAYLYEANLYGANLSGANLYGANLSGANLSGANLSGANLSGANLRGAYLSGANLSEADLEGANLSGANLYGAYLKDAKLSPFQIVPEEGTSFVGWKKLKNIDPTKEGVICKLLIPEDAQRTSSLIGRKCRASKVIVLEGEGFSSYNRVEFKTEYKAGETILPDSYDPDIRVECTHGIHFFITKQEAIDYQ